MTQPLDLIPENLSIFPPTRDDITFTHSVFAQCFLPLRKPKDDKFYEVQHGRASLVIQSGVLLNPETGKFEQQQVPYGSAARIILAHIHNHVIRASSLDEAQTIPMGDSLRDFFQNHRLSYGGKNGQQIVGQIGNIAAARITIGLWQDNKAKQINVPTLAEEIDFWLEKDDRQRTLWQPSMILNRRYAEAIRERRVPLDMRTLIGLYSKPRAMDVFTWLSYRLPLVKANNGVFIPFYGDSGLHAVFGAGIVRERLFRAEFIKTLNEVVRWYPEARLSIEEQGIRIYNSPSPIPAEHSIGTGKSLFFVDK